jgi:hypothetical protein
MIIWCKLYALELSKEFMHGILDHKLKRMQNTQMHQNDIRNYLHIFDFMSQAIDGIHG